MKMKYLQLIIILFNFLCASAQSSTQNHINDGIELYKIKKYQDAFSKFKKAAENGNAQAQYNLGICYYNGNGVEQNVDSAFLWWNKAAEKNDTLAMYNVTMLWFNENEMICDVDPVKMEEWLAIGANADYYGAQYAMGVLWDRREDFDGAKNWFEKSIKTAVGKNIAVEDYAGAYYYLGLYAFEKAEYVEAWGLWDKAANAGYVVAQNRLGDWYYYGDGDDSEPNYEKAVEWYRKAAEKNDSIALCRLGICYLEGKGVKKDEKKAVEYFEKAAQSGYSEAQYQLGVCYEKGKGVNEDKKKALNWYNEAASQEHENAKKAHEKLQEKMSPKDNNEDAEDLDAGEVEDNGKVGSPNVLDAPEEPQP